MNTYQKREAIAWVKAGAFTVLIFGTLAAVVFIGLANAGPHPPGIRADSLSVPAFARTTGKGYCRINRLYPHSSDTTSCKDMCIP